MNRPLNVAHSCTRRLYAPLRALARATLILTLVTALSACNALPKVFSIIEDPIIGQLIHDLEEIIAKITDLSTTATATPEGREAMQAAIDDQLKAAGQLIEQLKAAGEPKTANRYETELRPFLRLEPAAALEPLTS